MKCNHLFYKKQSFEQSGRAFRGISSFTLHIIAMLLMLCDHLWATILSQYAWLTWVGRIAYPIFAFMLVEGYFYTHNLKRYLGRLFFWAVLSELPFNLMYAGSPFYPFHQNVLWTFLLGLLCITLIEKVRQKGKKILTLIVFLLSAVVGYILGFVTMVDYFGYGIWMILVFYLFRGRKWWCLLGQFVGLYWINGMLIGGLSVPVQIFGHERFIVQQSMACLALAPIWLYKGKQGPHNKIIQTGFYAFYPVHMLVLSLIALL
ncbi:MAG: TraX family protein [Agathobacter sp.]